MRRRLLTTLVAVAMIGGAVRASQGGGPSSIDGRWVGWWTSFSNESRGFLYEATMTLTLDAKNGIDGRIDWKLLVNPRPAEQAKVGLTAVEFVRGSYDPASRVLRLAGYRKDDPNTVIGLDRYHLVVADSGQTIGGITESQNSWQGVFSTVRSR